MDSRYLHVMREEQVCATITLNSNRTFTLEYADAGITIPLSLSLPVRKRSSTHLIANWLAGLVPDSERLARYWARVAGAASSRPFDLLSSKLGWDAPGAFYFISPETKSEYAQKRTERPEIISQNEAGRWLCRISAAVDDRAPFGSNNVGAFSLAGGREKIGLRCVSEGIWQTTEGELPTTHILKAGHPRIPSHAAIEAMCLNMASLCGLNVSKTEFYDLEGMECLLAERWDRMDSADSDERKTVRLWVGNC